MRLQLDNASLIFHKKKNYNNNKSTTRDKTNIFLFVVISNKNVFRNKSILSLKIASI